MAITDFVTKKRLVKLIEVSIQNEIKKLIKDLEDKNTKNLSQRLLNMLVAANTFSINMATHIVRIKLINSADSQEKFNELFSEFKTLIEDKSSNTTR